MVCRKPKTGREANKTSRFEDFNGTPYEACFLEAHSGGLVDVQIGSGWPWSAGRTRYLDALSTW